MCHGPWEYFLSFSSLKSSSIRKLQEFLKTVWNFQKWEDFLCVCCLPHNLTISYTMLWRQMNPHMRNIAVHLYGKSRTWQWLKSKAIEKKNDIRLAEHSCFTIHITSRHSFMVSGLEVFKSTNWNANFWSGLRIQKLSLYGGLFFFPSKK